MKYEPDMREIARMPDGFGRIVAMCAHKGCVIVAAEHGAFLLVRGWFGGYRFRCLTPINRRWWQFWRRT